MKKARVNSTPPPPTRREVALWLGKDLRSDRERREALRAWLEICCPRRIDLGDRRVYILRCPCGDHHCAEVIDRPGDRPRLQCSRGCLMPAGYLQTHINQLLKD